MKARFTLVLLLLCLFACPFYAQEVEFNYEGRVSVDGLPYTGQGYFKFAIVNPNGQITYWSNDGTSAAGSEPAAEVVTDVTDGVFNVIIGDSSLPNMDPLEASIFNGDENVFLKVWFSDGLGAFEHLRPDRRITNPALLGSQSFREIHLYVNPTMGDDQYPGVSPGHPKQTIQAAWDSLPPMIRRDATIHLADGVYREEVLLSGKTIIGDATIGILGDEGNPDNVRVTGSDAGADTTPVRDCAFVMVNQRGLSIRGLLVNYCNYRGIWMKNGCTLELANCHLLNNYIGIHAEDNCRLVGEDLDIGDGVATLDAYTRGIYLEALSYLILRDSYVHDVYNGLGAASACVFDRISGCTITRCASRGIFIGFTQCNFYPPNTTVSYCTSAGFRAAYNSVASESNTYVNYSNNGTNREIVLGSVSND